MKIYPFKAIYPNLEQIDSPDLFFGKVKNKFNRLYQDQYFFEDGRDHLFVYQISTNKLSYTGLLACIDIKEYISGNILRHELTISSKEQKMKRLLEQRGVMTKPAMFTHKPIASLEHIYRSITSQKKPLLQVNFENEDQQHTIFKIPKGKINREIIEIFENQVSKVFIADGHHRCSITSTLYQAAVMNGHSTDVNKLLCGLFAFDQLDIYEYNRVVIVPYYLKATWIINNISKCCDIVPMKYRDKPKDKHEMTMILHGDWYLLKWKNIIVKKYSVREMSSDIEILNEEILKAIFGFTDIRSDSRIKYVEGKAGLDEIVDIASKKTNAIGFCLHAVSLKELVKISKEGKTLPPKSTWIEPKIKNGLISKRFFIDKMV